MKFHWIKRLGIVTSFALFSSMFAVSADAQDGQALYKANCASCHKLDKNSTGPALQGARARWEDAGEAENIYSWIKDPSALISSGVSARAKEMEGFSPTAMTPQGTLSREEVDAILQYADDYVAPAPAVADNNVSGGKEESSNVVLWLIVLGVVVVVIIFSASGVRRQLAHVVNEKEGVEVDITKSTKQKLGEWIVRNWKLNLILFLVVVVTGGADLMQKGFQVGVFQDYQPSQTLAYSHKLHAGDMGIECKYCHNSAEKSKHAGIPTVNVCMNCHRMVPEGKTTGTEEIAKIYEAAGYDKDSQTYTGEEKPLIWNKAHNLPDHVFFSHAQHVNPNTADLDCRQCHGDVKTYTLGRVSTIEEINALAAEDAKIMPLTKPLLTMGWCIECHNEKGIDLGKGGYYKEIHERLKSRPDFMRKITDDDKVTVRELGGWECAKCHY